MKNALWVKILEGKIGKGPDNEGPGNSDSRFETLVNENALKISE